MGRKLGLILCAGGVAGWRGQPSSTVLASARLPRHGCRLSCAAAPPAPPPCSGCELYHAYAATDSCARRLWHAWLWS